MKNFFYVGEMRMAFTPFVKACLGIYPVAREKILDISGTRNPAPDTPDLPANDCIIHDVRVSYYRTLNEEE